MVTIPLDFNLVLERTSQIHGCLAVSSDLASSGHFHRSDPDALLLVLHSVQFAHYCQFSRLHLLHGPSYLCHGPSGPDGMADGAPAPLPVD